MTAPEPIRRALYLQGDRIVESIFALLVIAALILAGVS